MKKIIFISLICVGLMCCTQTETQEKRIENTKKENADPTVKTDAKGGFKVLSFDKNVIPKEITLKGTIAEGAKWNDANGENMLILTTVAEFSSKKKKGEELEERDAELYAYHFVKKGDTYAELWKIQEVRSG